MNDTVKKKSNPYSGYILLALAGLLFALGSYLRAPQMGEHKLLVETGARGEVFEKSVVFVTSYTRGGAKGYVLNKRNVGGPLEPEKVTVLHSNDIDLPGTTFVGKLGIGVAEGEVAAKALQDAPKKPKWAAVLKGYSSWGPGQLDDELRRREWKVVDYDSQIVMRTPIAQMWQAAKKKPEASADKKPEKQVIQENKDGAADEKSGRKLIGKVN